MAQLLIHRCKSKACLSHSVPHYKNYCFSTLRHGFLESTSKNQTPALNVEETNIYRENLGNMENRTSSPKSIVALNTACISKMILPVGKKTAPNETWYSAAVAMAGLSKGMSRGCHSPVLALLFLGLWAAELLWEFLFPRGCQLTQAAILPDSRLLLLEQILLWKFKKR